MTPTVDRTAWFDVSLMAIAVRLPMYKCPQCGCVHWVRSCRMHLSGLSVQVPYRKPGNRSSSLDHRVVVGGTIVEELDDIICCWLHGFPLLQHQSPECNFHCQVNRSRVILEFACDLLERSSRAMWLCYRAMFNLPQSMTGAVKNNLKGSFASCQLYSSACADSHYVT